MKDSKLVQADPKKYTEDTYQVNEFDPATETEKLSYTSARVAKRVYNTYHPSKGEEFSIFGYYTDWAQYDGRLIFEDAFQLKKLKDKFPIEEDYQKELLRIKKMDGGRGVNGTEVPANAYDKLILGFLGMVGDQGVNSNVIDIAGKELLGGGDNKYKVTFTDSWADLLAGNNCGFTWSDITLENAYQETKAKGMMGLLREKKKEKQNLRIGVCIGGWTMSNLFSEMAQQKSSRTIFIDSVIDILDRFPIISDLDIDWEYPGMEGNGNPCNEKEDSINFQQLIKELKAKLVEKNKKIFISIASSATIHGLTLLDVKGMLDAGVDGVNIMTYDFFGSWANRLGHHTNLKKSKNDDKKGYSKDAFVPHCSIQASVDFLKNTVKLNPKELKKIFIGYAAYSRSASGADVTSFSPLEGTYNKGAKTTGSFDDGATEWPDIIYNYLDLENKSGRNGFVLYTDDDADADYLYNKESKLFLSIDTPRTVKAKGEYARANGLGGLFTWTADMDNGLLVNAAREGLGFTVKNQKVDMAQFYFKGVNSGDSPIVTPDKKQNTQKDEKHEASSGLAAKINVIFDDEISLSAKHSSNADTVLWRTKDLPFDKSDKPVVKIPQDTFGEFDITLTVSDTKGEKDSSNMILSIKKQKGNEPKTPSIKPKEPQVKPGIPKENDGIELWDKNKTYDTSYHDKLVRHNYNGEGERIYKNNFYAAPGQEPGDPEYTAQYGKQWILQEK